jgi:transposase-like protein
VVDEQQPDDGTGAVRRRPFPGRRGHPPELRERAAELRRQGWSRARIARRLGIGFSTLGRWFRDDGVPAPPPDTVAADLRRLSLRRTVEERWAHEQAEQDAHRDTVGRLTARELLLVGAALYAAEGSKSKPWRRSHTLRFVNSDPAMIRVYLAWLEALGVKPQRLRCALLIHETADVAAAEAYWRQVVGPDAVFNATTLKRHRPTTVRRNTDGTYHGCLSVGVAKGAPIYRLAAGTWEGIVAAVTSGAAE